MRDRFARWLVRTVTRAAVRVAERVAGQITDPMAGLDDVICGLDEDEFTDLRHAAGDADERWRDALFAEWEEANEAAMDR